MIQNQRVEMRPAYQWTCEECGEDQFESCMVAEFSEEDRIETARRCGLIQEFETDVPDDLEGEFVTYPDSVTCEKCGSTFETKSMQEDE